LYILSQHLGIWLPLLIIRMILLRLVVFAMEFWLVQFFLRWSKRNWWWRDIREVDWLEYWRFILILVVLNSYSLILVELCRDFLLKWHVLIICIQSILAIFINRWDKHPGCFFKAYKTRDVLFPVILDTSILNVIHDTVKQSFDISQVLTNSFSSFEDRNWMQLSIPYLWISWLMFPIRNRS